jgi:hypothetical protein
MSGRVTLSSPAVRDNFRGEESHRRQEGGRRHGGMTAGQIRWLIAGVLFLAWFAARSLLRWWPHLLGQPG